MRSYQSNILSFRRASISFLLKAICILSIFLFAPFIYAKQVTICNVSPLEISIAIRLGSNPEHPTIGWFNQMPGDCSAWNINDNEFYYYAQSYEKLAYWINDGKPQKWSSILGNSMCVDPTLAFEMLANGSCQTKYNFNRVALHNTNEHTINLYAKNHKHLMIEDLHIVRNQLTGVMDFENMLRNSLENEPPFQLGINVESDYAGNGARIIKVFPGMPAENEGLEANDKIILLNNYRIENKRDLIWVLENISLFEVEPLSMTVIRNGHRIDGTIEPMFFPFKHWEYSPDGKAGTFLWAAIDSAAFGFGNEITCAVPQALLGGLALAIDGLSVALSDNKAASKDQIFNGKQLSDNYSKCTKSLNMELAKKQLLYGDAYNAGFWAGLLIPALPSARYLKAKKAFPLAGRSRQVARSPGAKAFQGRY